MRYALIEGQLIEAQPGLQGLCPGCFQLVIAKCGAQRIHHWAHLSTKTCDSWWEPETEWHRSWKNNFPAQWQERFLPDKATGEKHVADVCTPGGLVIEFQHSHIDSMERTTREKFYRNMAWVLDSARLKRDYPRFLKERNNFRPIRQGIYRVDYPEGCFPPTWLDSSVPVIFDFRGYEPIADTKDMRNEIYCLFPGRIGQHAFVAILSRKAFINAAIDGNWTSWVGKIVSNINQVNQEMQNQIAKHQRIQDNRNFERFSKAMRYGRGRRF